jgi:translation initiation factor 2 subunit 3
MAQKKKTASKKTTKVKKGKSSASQKKVANIAPDINIGLVGHVDHGKTTLTQAFSGKWTDTHSEELKRGITIRLGYADAIFYHDEKTDTYLTQEKTADGKKATLLRKISIVDAPGHESLMATMLAGTTIMDGALLLISANERCPQPQTREHLMALQMSNIEKVIVVQNKIDLVSKEEALKNYKQIKAFLKDTAYENAPIIPISARHNLNISLLIKAIEEHIPTPKRDTSLDPLMVVARSFDINKPGSASDKIVGGVLGGAVKQGTFSVGDEIEIRPGHVYEERNQLTYAPYVTTITGLMTGGAAQEVISPGGSSAIMTKLDPSIVKSDKLVGCTVGRPGTLPPVWKRVELEITLLERVVGAHEDKQVEPLREREALMLNVNSAATVGVITELSKKRTVLQLRLPICAKVGDRVTLSRRIDNRFRLIGFGIILDAKTE